MEDKIIKPQGLQKKVKLTIKIQYDNGANETIYPVGAPNVNPVTPMMIEYPIKKGQIRSVNLSKIRTMDTFIEETDEVKIITE